MNPDRYAVHDYAERCLLGAVITDGSLFPKAAAIIKTDDYFVSHPNCLTWRAMVALTQKHEPIDLLTVVASLEDAGALQLAGGAARVAGLLDGVPCVDHVETYAKKVRGYAFERKLTNKEDE